MRAPVSKNKEEAGEIVQWLRALVHVEDPGLIPSSHMVVCNHLLEGHPNTKLTLTPSLGDLTVINVVHNMHAGKTFIYIK